MIKYSESLQELAAKTNKNISELIGKGDTIQIP